MKKINLIEWLSRNSHEKQKPQRFARYAAMLIMLLTLGVGQMWAGAGLYEVYFTYSYNGTTGEKTCTSSGTETIDLGTLTANFDITSLYLKYWKDGSGNMCGGLVEYYLSSDQEYIPSWNWSDLTGNNHQLGWSGTWNIASYTGASGAYTFWYRFKTWGSSSSSSNCGDNNYYIPTDGSSKNKFTYNVAPPAVSSFAVTPTGAISGSGTSVDPYIVPYGGDLKLTMSGSKAHTDANSTAKYYNTSSASSWTSQTYKTVSNVTNTASASSVTIKMCYENNTTSSLKGTQSSATIYYKAAKGTTVYKFQTKSSGLGTSAVGANSLTTSNALQALVGGTLSCSANNANVAYNTNCIRFTGGSGAHLVIGLDNKIKAGDIIRYVNNNSGSVAIRTASGTSTNQIELPGKSTTDIQTVVITAAQATAFASNTTVYMVRTSNTSDISYFEIYRPGEVTLDANTNGGKVNGNNTATADANGSNYFPRAVKSDYRFKGWFVASSGGSAVTEPYLSLTNTTLYAQYEDIPDNGTMYKVQVGTGLTNGNIAAGTTNAWTGGYLSSILGGSLNLICGSAGNLTIYGQNSIRFAANTGYMKIDLESPLQAGDTIKTIITGNTTWLHYNTTRTQTMTIASSSNASAYQKQVIPAALADKSTVYLFYGGGQANLLYFEVIRPAVSNRLTVSTTEGGTITTPASGYYDNISATSYSIAATRTEGYKFTGWTQEGDGVVTFGDASSLSTTATVTTVDNVTVTANFAAMSNSLSVSSSTLYAGDNITLTATKTNHTLDLTYQYKIGSGAWTDIATQSGTSKTWQIPYANTYQTYKFRVKSTDGSTSFYSSEQTVNVKGRIIIHVKNTNSWATMKLYSWYNNGSDVPTNGDWNGTTGTGSNGQSCSVHATGSQWWDVTITQTTSNAQKFILSCSTSGNQNKTADLNLSSFTHDAYYAMSTNGSSAQTLSTTTTPSAPTVSTLTAGTIRETSAVLGGNIANAAALGNDIITERGYYWSTNSALSSSNLGVGTKVTISGTQSAAGNFSGTKSGLTAGTTYYFLAYAKNGYGTGYSSVQNFTTLSTYTVTVTAGAGGSASPSSVTAGQYQLSGTITASANTDYTFYNWTKTSGDGTVTFTNANAASTTLKSTSTATVRANFVDMWNVKGSWDSWAAYEPMTATGVSNTYSATKTLAAKTEYHIKVVKRVDNNSSNDKWYGVNGGTTLSRATGSVTGLEENGGGDEYITFTTDAAGDYTITYLYNASVGSMKVTVGYPTAYTMTFAPKTFLNGSSTGTTSTTGGTLTAKDQTNASLSTGDKVKNGGTATFTATKNTGYTFNGFFKNEVCTTAYAAGSGVVISDNVMTLDIDADKSVYAKFSENMTTVNLVASPTGKGTFTSGGGAVTSVSAGVTTHPTVTAVPASGYRVNTSATVWSESSDYISISATNAAATTITASGETGKTATLTATFTPNNYTITLNDNDGSGGVGSATVTFDDDNFAFATSFVAPTRTGYIFQGYYTNGTVGYGDQIINKDGEWIDGAGSNYYIDGEGNWVYAGDKTIYAQWTPITFTIHYDANGGSGSMDDQVAKYEVESSLDGQNSFIDVKRFTAPTGYGTYLPAHPWNTSADGTGTDIDAATYQSTLTSTNGATVNLYAQWSGKFALKANYDGGVDGYFRVHYNTSIIEALTTLYPTRYGYLCDGYYTADEDGTKVLNGDGTVVEGNVSGYVTGGKWTYKGTQDFYAYWSQIKYNLTFDANDCASYVGEATGSKASVADVAYETYVDITAGTLAREGYTFAGWSKTECATSASYMGDTWRRISHVDGDDVTLYAVWTPKTYTITFNALGGDCYTPSKTVDMGDEYGYLPTAYGKSGYEFVGWYTRPTGGTLVTDETQMVTASDHTLYAHYEKKERVYFNNTLGWDSVFVTWDATWNYNSQDKGAGSKGKTHEGMNKIYGTNIWYKDVPAAIISSWKGNIAFTNTRMNNYEWFDEGQAVYRHDFDSDATMFVPTPNDPNKYTKNTHDDKPGTVYYSTDMIVDKDKDQNVTNYRYKNGYWVRYDELQSGYTVKGSWAWDDDHYVERHSLNDSTYEFTIRNLSANSDYWFNLYKHCTTSNNYSSVFKPAADMTSASSDVVFSAQYAGGSDKKMTTTVAGDYTFKFVFSRLGEIRLTIKYPLAVNDYRVVYGYTKGSAQTFASEYIKAEANAEDTISMFIHSADSATSRSLYIQKCTTLVAGVPSWNTTYSAITLPSETASGKSSGVYNFRIAQNGSAAATGESIGKYEGNYYIRTDSAAGGWDFYKEYPSSQMTFSEYSLSQTLSSPYSHYYCQYIGNTATDISYTIATDYSPAICPVMTGDATIGVGNTKLPSGKPASVRFTWNQETNTTFRSYLKSAQGDGNTRYLLIHGAEDDMIFNSAGAVIADSVGKSMYANELLFKDVENWVYELAIKAKPGAQVSIIAQYNDVDRYLVGSTTSWEKIISGGTSSTQYDIAAVYDFKTNRLITTWIPSGTISEQIEEVDVLIERHNQDGATTITFGKAAVDKEAGSISAKRVIGALRFDYNELVGRVARWTSDTRAKMMFFVSFPFDVNVSDIFGLNTNYGEAFIVQGYNGAKRAEKGFFKGDGTDTFWETLPVDTVMHAGVGYVVTLDNDYFNGDVGHIWDNKRAGDHVYMYFPSANDPEDPIIINSDAKTINVPAHLCTINRTFNGGKLNHKYTDSNWNVMGVPIFQNHTGDDGIAGTPGAFFTATEEPEDTTSYADPKNPAFGYFYVWNTDKTYTIQSAVDFVFKPMHSYMVQYAGDVKFTCAQPSVVPASVAPRRTAMKENYNIELQVLNNSGDMLNHTYVELRENAVDSFALNEDIYMMSSNKAVSVYTFAGTYDVAANVLSIGSHVVPVGVIVKQAGTYTFTMPSNFSGTVTLVDTYAQTRTNLNIEDYEVSLPKGTDEERFYLEINISNVPTAIDGVGADNSSLKDGNAHKFIMNDMLYILKDGVLYDARGNRVK